MSDEDLGRELAPDETPENQARLVRALSDQDRQRYEHMIFVANELNSGRVPDGVIVCRDRCSQHNHPNGDRAHDPSQPIHRRIEWRKRLPR